MMRALTGLILFFVLAGPATAETLVTSLSRREVAITSTYQGSQIVVFGVIERDATSVSRVGPYDIVITARGPRRTTIVREKERAGPIWINRARRRFVDLPVFLSILATRPLGDIATSTIRQRFGLGVDALLTPVGLDMELDTSEMRFREALLRLKTGDGLFAEDARGITFLTPTVFQATIALPATAPTGTYDVEIALLTGGSLITRHSTTFEVIKTGFEEVVITTARDRPFLYGLGVAALAVLFGWFASVVFRRD